MEIWHAINHFLDLAWMWGGAIANLVLFVPLVLVVVLSVVVPIVGWWCSLWFVR